jgi:hypothetical protein
LLPQSDLTGISSGQQGMSADMSTPAMSSMVAAPEGAITLSAALMLMGPTTIPSTAATTSSRLVPFMSFIFPIWHASASL